MRDFPPMANLAVFDPQGADRRRGKTTTDQDEAAADRSIVLLIVKSVCATRIATMSAASDSVVISSPDPAKNSGPFAPREQNSYTYLANSAPRIKELRMQPAFTKLQNIKPRIERGIAMISAFNCIYLVDLTTSIKKKER